MKRKTHQIQLGGVLMTTVGSGKRVSYESGRVAGGVGVLDGALTSTGGVGAGALTSDFAGSACTSSGLGSLGEAAAVSSGLGSVGGGVGTLGTDFGSVGTEILKGVLTGGMLVASFSFAPLDNPSNVLAMLIPPYLTLLGLIYSTIAQPDKPEDNAGSVVLIDEGELLLN